MDKLDELKQPPTLKERAEAAQRGIALTKQLADMLAASKEKRDRDRQNENK